MNISKLLRTSSFRLTLLYTGLTGLSFLVLFAIVYLSMTRFMQNQIDVSIDNELKEIRNREVRPEVRNEIDDIRRLVDISVTQSPGFFYLLQNSAGDVLGGNLPPMDARVGIREWTEPNRLPEHANLELRGRGVNIADGGYLLVAQSRHQLDEMKESIVRSFLWGLAAAMLVALIGGALMSLSVLRRIELVSRTSRNIVDGDLEQRIPLSGSGDEFDHLGISLNVMLDRIQLLMEGVRQVSTDIAHDLRTPLTRLRQRLELAQQLPPDAQRLQATLGATLTDVDAILQTFAALLRIAQIEGGARKSRFSKVDLSDLLATVVEVYQPAIDEKSQTLHTDIPPGMSISGDRELLTQLFANLMENATLHCARGAQIALAARVIGADATVSIADDGPGIPAMMRDKVLQRFVRLDASRTTPGNGLGLSMVAAVVTLHDARLTLSDNAPGLRATVALPLDETRN
jgi:signal transduction histidine kinase